MWWRMGLTVALTCGEATGAQAWGSHYFVKEALVPLTVIDTSLVVEFWAAPTTSQLDSLESAKSFLRPSSRNHYAPRFVWFTLADGMDTDSASVELIGSPGIARVLPVYATQAGGTLLITDRVSVNFADGLSLVEMDSIANLYNASVIELDEYDGSYCICAVDSGAGTNALDVGNAMNSDASVEWSCASFYADIRRHVPVTPNDPY